MGGDWVINWEQAAAAGAGVAGGKGPNLGRLHRYGFPVPPGGCRPCRKRSQARTPVADRKAKDDAWRAETPPDVLIVDAEGHPTVLEKAAVEAVLPGAARESARPGPVRSGSPVWAWPPVGPAGRPASSGIPPKDTCCKQAKSWWHLPPTLAGRHCSCGRRPSSWRSAAICPTGPLWPASMASLLWSTSPVCWTPSGTAGAWR